MTTNLFDRESINTPTEATPSIEGSYVDALVGEGKKFRTVEDLAKGKIESDEKFIPQLQRENAAQRDLIKQLETQLNERITLEEFMNELKTPADADDGTSRLSASSNVNAPSPATQDSLPVVRQDIAKIIDERLQEQRKREQIQANLTTVANTLQATWGADWQNKLHERARELNLSHKFLDDVAKESPQGFLNVVLPQSAPTRVDPNTDLPPRTSSSRVTPTQDVGARNKAYYDKLRQTDPKTYHSEAVTKQRHRDAQRLGESFFQ